MRGEIVLTDATTAEMVKLMENTFRDINIAAANEFARLADQFQVDIWEAIALANRHPRVKILNPGPGVGGHCISVDPWFLVEAAPDTAQLIRTARTVNDSQPDYVLEFIEKKSGGVADKRITVLGLAYKPMWMTCGNRPQSKSRGCSSKPAPRSPLRTIQNQFYLEGAESADNLNEALAGADVLLLLVGHTQFKEMDPREIRKQTNAVMVVDAVNGWERDAWQSAGFSFHRIGDGKN